MKYLIGPWRIFEGKRDDVNLPRANRTDRFIGIVDQNNLPLVELHVGSVRKNLNLIAAAPDLLEALRAIAMEFENYDYANAEDSDSEKCRLELLAQAHAAIEKAEGKK